LIKGGSSKWTHEKRPKYKKFAWQEGYGAFSVSVSQMKRTISYIHAQKEHHRKKTFQEEFLELLDKHGIEYDPRYVFILGISPRSGRMKVAQQFIAGITFAGHGQVCVADD